jgi:hypothetical protein
VREVAVIAVAKEAVATTVAKEAMVVVAAKEATPTAKEAPDTTLDLKAAAEKTATTTESSDAGGDGPRAAQVDATSDPKVAAKRPAAMMGSGGSSPPCKHFRDDWRYAIYFLEDFLFLSIFCAGLLTLASTLEDIEPKCHTVIPGVRSLWYYQGGGPLGFSGRSGS